MPLWGGRQLSAADPPHFSGAVLCITRKAIHAVELLPLLLNRWPMSALLRLGEEVVARVELDMVVDEWLR